MARIRLTNKTKIANDPADMEGLRQDCGKKTRYEKYTNFDPEKDDIGGRGKADTDGSKLYEGDKALRNEMHITEIRIKQAKMWQRSKLATKLAMYLLGEKAPQSMIKAQAAQFLSLGNAKLAKAVSRWAKTEYLYADEDQEKAEAPADEDGDAEAPAQDEAPADEDGDAEAPAQDEAPADKDGDAEAPAQDEAPADEDQGDAEALDDNACPTEPKAEACPVATVPQQVVQQKPTATTTDTEDITDAALAQLFENNSNTLVANKNTKATAGKVGVQKFDQPQRVASNKVSLDQLWEGAPDLSNIFN